MNKFESFKVLLDAIHDEIKEKLEDYYDEVQINMDNFPVVDYNLFLMQLNETSWSLLGRCVQDDGELADYRYNWLMSLGKEVIGNDFIDFGNLTEKDEKYLKKTYTYFEEMDNSCDEEYVKYKSEYTDENGDNIFDPETGEIINSDRYEYVGEGVVMDNETGEEI